MNASDIVTSKQNQILRTSYHPTVFHSSLYQTVYPISSIGGGSTHYGSTVHTLYDSLCAPTFTTYELRNEVLPRHVTPLKWKATQSTLLYAYRTVYSTLSTPSTILTTSTSILTAPGPTICSTDEPRQ